MDKLTKKFFEQPTLIVAKKLLGKILVFQKYQGIITETEAYIGENDPACHAAKGKTKRTAIMYGTAGHSYIYMIYGMYYCLNIVTEPAGFPAAVLIRGLILPATLMQHNLQRPPNTRQKTFKLPEDLILDGPGKLCRQLGITTAYNGINLAVSEFFYLKNTYNNKKIEYISTPRIGIKIGLDKLWRFKIK